MSPLIFPTFITVALVISYGVACIIRLIRMIADRRERARRTAREIIDATQWDLRYRAGLDGWQPEPRGRTSPLRHQHIRIQ